MEMARVYGTVALLREQNGRNATDATLQSSGQSLAADPSRMVITADWCAWRNSAENYKPVTKTSWESAVFWAGVPSLGAFYRTH